MIEKGSLTRGAQTRISSELAAEPARSTSGSLRQTQIIAWSDATRRAGRAC